MEWADSEKQEINLLEVVRKGIRGNASKPALRFFMDSKDYTTVFEYSFKEVIGKIQQVANLLNAYGISKNDVISIVLPNLPETIFSILGGQLVGIVNPINPDLPADQIQDLLNQACTKVLITLAPFPKETLWEKIDQLRGKVPTLQYIFRVDLRDYLSGFALVLAYSIALFKNEKNNQPQQHIHDFHLEVEEFTSKSLDFEPKIKNTDTSAYLMTNGTTNVPKLVRHSTKSQVTNLLNLLAVLPFQDGERVLLGTPLWHAFGHSASLLTAWHRGLCVVLAGKKGFYDKNLTENFWKINQHYRTNYFSAMSCFFEQLSEMPIPKEKNSLRLAFCGGDFLSEKVQELFEQKMQLSILTGYGFTEGVGVSTLNTDYANKKSSVGRSLPNQEIKIAILDEFGYFLRNAQAEETGVVLCRGTNIFIGYKEGIHNHKIWVDCKDGKQRWFNTGDIGKMDKDGFLWILGRNKDTIKSGEKIINLTILEKQLQHPAILKMVLVSRPDIHLGKIVVAYVVPKNKDTQDCTDFLMKNNISLIRFIDQIHHKANGKVAKNDFFWKENSSFVEAQLRNIPKIAHFEVQLISQHIIGESLAISVSPKEGVSSAELYTEIEQLFRHVDFLYKLRFF